MVLTDAALLKGRDVVDAARRAVRGGATAVQVRLKGVPARDVVASARALAQALEVPVLVNDRVDIALAAGAAGAHLGQDDVPLDALRAHIPAPFILGVSVGTAAEAGRAATCCADYWSIGPCFETSHKTDAGAPLGPEGFADLARLAPTGVPVLGIGGITALNAGALRHAGAAGIAVIGAVWETSDPESAARALRRAFA